jgi:hypothetical protein
MGRKIAAIDFNHDGQHIAPSISFGLAGITDTKMPLSHAFAAAETACKAAKELGRARVELYRAAARTVEPAKEKRVEPPPARSAEPVKEKRAEPKKARSAEPAPAPVLTTPVPAPAPAPRYDDVAILDSLRDAIASDRFRMEAQPIIQIGSTAPARHFELLLRMIEPSGESVAPEKFLAAAERNGLATDIDRWVVQYALEILSSAAPPLQGMGASFAINLSAQSVIDIGFAEYLARKLREYELPPRWVSPSPTDKTSSSLGRSSVSESKSQSIYRASPFSSGFISIRVPFKSTSDPQPTGVRMKDCSSGIRLSTTSDSS